jgi:uncharacterized protein
MVHMVLSRMRRLACLPLLLTFACAAGCASNRGSVVAPSDGAVAPVDVPRAADRPDTPAPTTDARASGPPTDVAPATPDAQRPDADTTAARVLIYTRATGFVHASTRTAAERLAAAAIAAGVDAQISDDPSLFTASGLAPFRGVVLIATSGAPFGEGAQGTAGVRALATFVRAGGGLIGIENATNAYNDNPEYVGLLGAIFNGHPGDVRTTDCTPVREHPAVAALPARWTVKDEFYVSRNFRSDNQVILRCGAEELPISWVRQEGLGRIFFTALGHPPEAWTQGRLVPDHVLPGLLWALGGR